ncbi:hypothetical protein OAS67_08795 [Alphaproteobacteria bacterium]|nr:hypothetical protein [Alphaproteobacteria bacterium]
MKLRKLNEYIYCSLNELFASVGGGMTVEDEKELLEYVKENMPTIDMVDYVEIWMEMNAENREDEIWMEMNAKNREEEAA